MRTRLAIGLALVVASIVLWSTLFVPTRPRALPPSTASVSQYRSNATASTSPTIELPTQTRIAIQYPAGMTIDETRTLSARVERFTVGEGFPEPGPDGRLVSKTFYEPIKAASRDFTMTLVSSGFDTQGIATAKEGTPFPLTFAWTLSPKREGRHDVLLDLSNVMRDARYDSPTIGSTEVQVAGAVVALADGTALPLRIDVTGAGGIPSWIVKLGASVPGLVGFVLTYPLFVEWLRKRRAVPAPYRHVPRKPR